MNKFAWILLVFVLAGCETGDSPAPDVPPVVVTGAEKPVPVGELVTLTVAPYNFPSNIINVHYEWKVIDSEGPKKVWLSENNQSVSFGTGSRPGKITAIIDPTYVYGDPSSKVATDVKSAGISLIEVQVGDPSPSPTPQPTPPPTPTPEPVPTPVPPPVPPVPPVPPSTNELYISYIFDSSKDVPQSIADMRASLAFGWSLYDLKGFRAYDISQDDIDKLNLRKTINDALSQGKTVPLVIFQSKDASEKIAAVVSVISPKTADEVFAETKRLKGIK